MDFNSWLTNQGIDPNVVPDRERVREVYEQAQLRGEACRQAPWDRVPPVATDMPSP